jgi:cbb3-type cytochrome oxidase subunit 3
VPASRRRGRGRPPTDQAALRRERIQKNATATMTTSATTAAMILLVVMAVVIRYRRRNPQRRNRCRRHEMTQGGADSVGTEQPQVTQGRVCAWVQRRGVGNPDDRRDAYPGCAGRAAMARRSVARLPPASREQRR